MRKTAKKFTITEAVRKAALAAEQDGDCLTVYRLFQDVADQLDELAEATTAIAQAWGSVPENVQVPEEINDDALWSRVRFSLRKMKA